MKKTTWKMENGEWKIAPISILNGPTAREGQSAIGREIGYFRNRYYHRNGLVPELFARKIDQTITKFAAVRGVFLMLDTSS